MLELIVTTVKDKQELEIIAREISAELSCPFVPRQKQSRQTLACKYGNGSLITIVVGEKKLSAWVGDKELFFHPSMALLRLINYLRYGRDRMAEAMGLEPGIRVLDCTLGFGTDALVASYLGGPDAKIVGLEASPVISLLVRRGLASYPWKAHSGLEQDKAAVLQNLPQAMSRISVINCNYRTYLAEAEDNSFDIVYFDPMFRTPVEDSASMSPLRGIALPDPVDEESIQEARRVASKCVVLKESRYSGEFSRLGFTTVPGGKYSAVAYGVIDLRSGEK